MARYNFLGRAVDTYGNTKPNEGVTIYLSGTQTPATIYIQRIGGIGISSIPQITTDVYGRFNFYLDDIDYPLSGNTKVDIVAAGLKYSDIEIMRGVKVHHALEELNDDDHPQYLLDNEFKSHILSAGVHKKQEEIEDLVNNLLIAGTNIDLTYNDLTGTLEISASSGVTSHLDLTNIGNNSHANIDTHISNSTLHFIKGSIDHTGILNIGSYSHLQLDGHVDNSTLHFTKGNIDHGGILGLLDDDHPQYALDTKVDSHLASAGVHFIEGNIDHGSVSGLLDDDHPQYGSRNVLNAHLASAGVHFTNDSLGEIIDDQVANLLIAGPNITLTYNDSTGTLEISAYTPSGSGGVSDHGKLTGLLDDDHPQYALDTKVNTLDTKVDSHLASAGVHFIESSIDHGSVSGLLDDDHPQYGSRNVLNAHLASAGVHFIEGNIDHGSVSGLLDDDHPQYGSRNVLNAHLASAGVHFTESSIDHTAIQNIGTNSHSDIDGHINDLTLHFIESLIDHGSVSGLLDDDHPQYGSRNVLNAHLASAGVHFTSKSLSAASVEQDKREREATNVQILSVSAASVEQDNRLNNLIDTNTTNITTNVTNIASVSAASVEQDNRLNNLIDTNTTNITTNVTNIASVSAASVEQDNRLNNLIDTNTTNITTNVTNIASVSAASVEQDKRERAFTNVQILSVSAASVEQDNRLQSNIDNLITLNSSPANQISNGTKTTWQTSGSNYGMGLAVSSGGDLIKAQGNSTYTIPCIALDIEGGGPNVKEVLLKGFITNNTWNWDLGLGGSDGLVYVSTTSAGALTQSPTDNVGDMIQVVGVAKSPTTIFFNPDYTWVEIV